MKVMGSLKMPLNGRFWWNLKTKTSISTLQLSPQKFMGPIYEFGKLCAFLKKVWGKYLGCAFKEALSYLDILEKDLIV